jgi:hypothetical protein
MGREGTINLANTINDTTIKDNIHISILFGQNISLALFDRNITTSV